MPRRPLLYQVEYTWLVFAACLDLMMTWSVLWFGGREVNVLARAVLERFELVGFVLFKLALVVLFIVICESVGRRRPQTGRRLARAAVTITAMPVALAFALLYRR